MGSCKWLPGQWSVVVSELLNSGKGLGRARGVSAPTPPRIGCFRARRPLGGGRWRVTDATAAPATGCSSRRLLGQIRFTPGA